MSDFGVEHNKRMGRVETECTLQELVDILADLEASGTPLDDFMPRLVRDAIRARSLWGKVREMAGNPRDTLQ